MTNYEMTHMELVVALVEHVHMDSLEKAVIVYQENSI